MDWGRDNGEKAENFQVRAEAKVRWEFSAERPGRGGGEAASVWDESVGTGAPCLRCLWWPAWGAGWRMGCTRQICLFLPSLLSQSRMASDDQENKDGLGSPTHSQGAHVRKTPPRGPVGSAFTLERSRGTSGGVASEQCLGMAGVFKRREGRVYWSAQTAMRKYHRRGSLTSIYLSQFWSWKSEIRVGSAEGSSLAFRRPPPRCALQGRERACRDTNSIKGTHAVDPPEAS